MDVFCKNLPKIELHAHLNGSLSAATLKKLGCFNESVEEYQKLNNLLERHSRTLDECSHLFKVAHDVTNSKQSVYAATKDVIKEFHDDNVIYLELRATPRSGKKMTKEEYVETVVKAIKENKDDIIVKLLLCVDHRCNLNVLEEMLDLIIRMNYKYPDIVKGIDLCGKPNITVFHLNLFGKARANKLKLSLHCAEVKNDDDVNQILTLKPDRIRYGICIQPSDCRVTPNIICGKSENYKKYQVSDVCLNKDLPFSISTDYKGVFNTCLSLEYELFQKHFDFNEYKLWKVNYDSLHHLFASDIEKDKLSMILLEWKRKNIK